MEHPSNSRVLAVFLPPTFVIAELSLDLIVFASLKFGSSFDLRD